jgi:hypothetical protein
MVSAWTGQGPVSTPPKTLAYGVGAALFVLAFVGAGLGYKASLRGGGSDVGGEVANVDDSGALIAKPIVQLPAAPVASNTADNAADAEADNSDKATALEVRTAEAQRVQAATAKSGPDIDTILTSPSEKPTAPAKGSGDEAAPPGPPVKSDVPF